MVAKARAKIGTQTPTTSTTNYINIQPIIGCHNKKKFALAHNGQIFTEIKNK